MNCKSIVLAKAKKRCGNLEENMGDSNLMLFIQENVHGTPNWIGFEVTNVLLWLNPRKISMYPGEKNTVKDARLVY